MLIPFPGAYRPASDEGDPPTPSSTTDGIPDHAQREQLAVVGYLASNVAHEISSPLTTIRAIAQSLLVSLPEGAEAGFSMLDVESLRRDLGIIIEESGRAGSLIGSLLALARQEPAQRRPVFLTEVLARTVMLVGCRLESIDILLEAPFLEEDPTPPAWTRVWGDPHRLQQVLLNLVVNAQQAIRSVRPSGRIRLRLEHDKGMAAVIVEDDGPGIPPALQAEVFRPFFSTKKSGEGTGLGLSIAADIVRQHDGMIHLESSPLGGARFVLRLPSAPDAEQPRTGRDARGEGGPRRGRGRVLFVDDESALRVSFKRLLTKQGFDVTAEPTALDALRELRSAPYDVVVSDLRMPGLSGEEFHTRIAGEFPGLAGRVVFSSGDLTRRETREFLQRTGCPGLQKPYDMDALVAILDALLQNPPGRLSRVG